MSIHRVGLQKNFCFPWWKRDWNHRWVEGIPLPSSIPVYKYGTSTHTGEIGGRAILTHVHGCLLCVPSSRVDPSSCLQALHKNALSHMKALIKKRRARRDRPTVPGEKRKKGGNEGEKGNLLEWKLKKYFCYTKCQSLRSNPSLLIWYAQWLLGIRIIGAWVARTRSIIRVFDGERYEFLGKVRWTMLLLESWNNLRKWLSYSSTSRS